VVGIALKTLGLGYNATADDLRRCGLTEQDAQRRVQRLVQQVGAEGWAAQAPWAAVRGAPQGEH
jgi:hypothetical protein